MSFITTSFLYPGPVTTAGQPHHRQGELDALLARDKELDKLFERLYENNICQG